MTSAVGRNRACDACNPFYHSIPASLSPIPRAAVRRDRVQAAPVLLRSRSPGDRSQIQVAVREPGLDASTIRPRALGIVLTHELVRINSGAALREPVNRGGLAPWQKKRGGRLYRGTCGQRHPARDPRRIGAAEPVPFLPSFKRTFGRRTDITRIRRIERAKQLLADRQLSVTTIALDVGFSDKSRFSAAFHRLTGPNPELLSSQSRLEESGAGAGLPPSLPRSRQRSSPSRKRVSALWPASFGGVFRHPAMTALAAMQHMKMPIWTFQRHLAGLSLYSGAGTSRNCRGEVKLTRSAFPFRLAECRLWMVRPCSRPASV